MVLNSEYVDEAIRATIGIICTVLHEPWSCAGVSAAQRLHAVL